MRNPSFDLGTHRATLIGQEFGEIDVPLHWVAWWDSSWSRPEMKVIPRVTPYLDPLRIAHGTHAVQWFSFYRTHHAGLHSVWPHDPGTCSASVLRHTPGSASSTTRTYHSTAARTACLSPSKTVCLA